MPLTEFQKEILALLADNRSEASHFAGGLVLNAADDSPRFSHDFDIFHEAADAVSKASNAKVSRGEITVEIDWAADSAVRYFPIEKDPVLGWRLHLFDMATNKALALAARSVTRDYIDILELDAEFPLEATIWAACGKDPGFNPRMLLDWMMRFARINPAELDKIKARDLDPIEMKKQWIEISDRAREAIERVANAQPDLPIGIAFLDSEGKPRWVEESPDLAQHPPTVRGCLPRISGLD